MSATINVLSFNVWGIKGISKHVDTRMGLIAGKFDESNFDIICLQEQMQKKHVNVLFPSSSNRRWNVKRFVTSPFTGGGLTIASIYPFTSHLSVTFRAQGNFVMSLVGKGMSISRVKAAESTDIIVFNVHLESQLQKYSMVGYEGETNAPIRMAQILQLADLVLSTVNHGESFIIAGDFNCGPSPSRRSPELDFLFAYLKHKGVVIRATRKQRGGAGLETFNGDNVGDYDDHWTLSEDNCFNGFHFEDMPVSVDHIFFGFKPKNGESSIAGVLSLAARGRVELNKTSYSDSLNKNINLSDHYAVAATLDIGAKAQRVDSFELSKVEQKCISFAANVLKSGAINKNKKTNRVLVFSYIFGPIASILLFFGAPSMMLLQLILLLIASFWWVLAMIHGKFQVAALEQAAIEVSTLVNDQGW